MNLKIGALTLLLLNQLISVKADYDDDDDTQCYAETAEFIFDSYIMQDNSTKVHHQFRVEIECDCFGDATSVGETGPEQIVDTLGESSAGPVIVTGNAGSVDASWSGFMSGEGLKYTYTRSATFSCVKNDDSDTYEVEVIEEGPPEDDQFQQTGGGPLFTPEHETTTGTRSSKACGDPHFTTWHGERFSYHGECDLVLLRTATFGGGRGLEVQIRTTLLDQFSYIAEVAVRVGNHTLEFHHDKILLDGSLGPPSDDFLLSGYTVTKVIRNNQDVFRIHLDGQSSIRIGKRSIFMAVAVEGSSRHFRDSVGLLGDYGHGSKLARDGFTVIGDINKYGGEWQVRDNEPVLFQTTRSPQYPELCRLPVVRPRHLREADPEKRHQAEAACAHQDHPDDFENCVFDVVATGDVGMATAFDFL